MTKKIKALIADDEPLAREGLVHLLAGEPDIEVVGTCADGRSAATAITELRPDIAFLDVQMPRGNGFDVLARLTAPERPVVIFVTAYDHYAVKAFEACACDYLVKPFSDDRFRRSLDRARDLLRTRQTGDLAARVEDLLAYVRTMSAPATGEVAEARSGVPASSLSGMPASLDSSVSVAATATPSATAASAPEYLDRIVLKSKGDLHFIKTRDVQWIEAEGDFVKVHAAGQTQLVRETLQSMERKMDPAKFLRIHRSFLVNAEHIRKVVPALYGDYHVFLADGTKLRLSRNYRSRFKSSVLPAFSQLK